MKKLILLFVALVSFSAFAQTEQTTSTSSTYVAVGLSMSNSEGRTFGESSYPSVEFGVTRNDVSYGIVLGRGQLSGLVDGATSEDALNNYFYEFKVSPSFPVGSVSGNLILGVGSMFSTPNAMFIEYGIGVSKAMGGLTYGLTYSNWAGTDYITPSVSYSFN